jgi:ABC-type sulfate transport system permease component
VQLTIKIVSAASVSIGVKTLGSKQMSKYNWKITATKFGIVTAEIFVSGVIVYLTDIQAFLFLVPFAEAARNYLKNRNNYRNN